MRLERLYDKGRLGRGMTGVRRLNTAFRFLRDYERSGFLPSIRCPLGVECRGARRPDDDADVNRLDAVDRYLRGVRACGPVCFAVVKHFVIDDLPMSEYIRRNYLPNGGNVYEEIYGYLNQGLDLISEAYERGNNG